MQTREINPKIDACARTRRADPGEDLAAMFDAAAPRRFAAGEHLYHEGDDRARLFRIKTGEVTLYRLFPNGRRHVIEFAGAGSIIGLGADDLNAESAVANTPVTARPLAVSQLERRVAEEPELGLALIRLLSARVVEQQARCATLLTGTAVERVAGFLLDRVSNSSTNLGDPRELKLTVSRSTIAEHLGITPETMSRVLTGFREMRLLDYSRPSHLRLLDLRSLARLAGPAIALARPTGAAC